MSQSNRATLLPCLAKVTARLTATVVFPTPPLAAVDADPPTDGFKRIGDAFSFLELPPGLR